uniref:2-aminoethanethiol dioxygenase n=1 Tax=Timema genevievae TaxID=629358 RepID=A0A7R9PJF1_TIMGE|nr:unnamed protein product [Timema genevievae]
MTITIKRLSTTSESRRVSDRIVLLVEHLRTWRVEAHFGKITLTAPNQDSNLDLPVIDSLVYCESSSLDHVVTEHRVLLPVQIIPIRTNYANELVLKVEFRASVHAFVRRESGKPTLSTPSSVSNPDLLTIGSLVYHLQPLAQPRGEFQGWKPLQISLPTYHFSSLNLLKSYMRNSTNEARINGPHMATRIEKLWKQALLTFSNKNVLPPQVFDESFAKLKALAEDVTAVDVKLDSSLLNPSNQTHRSQTVKPPVTYVEIYEDDTVTIGIFILRPGARLPLHDHPHMHGILKVISGKLKLQSYTLRNRSQSIGEKKSLLSRVLRPKSLVAEKHPEVIVDETSGACVLTPVEKNLHEIHSIDGPAAFLDILSPPYDSDVPETAERSCHYFVEMPQSTDEEMLHNNMTRLYQVRSPSDFWSESAPYQGPNLRSSLFSFLVNIIGGTNLYASEAMLSVSLAAATEEERCWPTVQPVGTESLGSTWRSRCYPAPRRAPKTALWDDISPFSLLHLPREGEGASPDILEVPLNTPVPVAHEPGPDLKHVTIQDKYYVESSHRVCRKPDQCRSTHRKTNTEPLCDAEASDWLFSHTGTSLPVVHLTRTVGNIATLHLATVPDTDAAIGGTTREERSLWNGL